MSRSWLKLVLIAGIWSISFQVLGIPLNVLQGRESEGRQQEVRDRVQRLRVLLGTQALNFSALTESDSVFLKPVEFQRAHELKTVEYFKRKLLAAAEQLQLEEQYGAPATFDPSLFVHEQDQQAWERRRLFFDRVFGADFDVLVQELERQIGAVQESSGSTPLPQNAGSAIVARTQSLADYIAQAQPEVLLTHPAAEEGGEPVRERQTIESVLGKLYRVDVFDGVSTKLRFSKLDLPLGSLQTVADADEVALSLSMLISVRTDIDGYLVFALGYVVEKLEAQKTELTHRQTELEKRGLWFGEKEEHEANAEKLRKLERVLVHVREQYSGAQTAHQLLERLSDEQLDFLIDLMLQLRGTDVPVARDMEGLAGLAHAQPDQALASYQFYKQMDDELYRLENFLTAENEMMAKVQKIIEGMKK